MIYQIEVTEPAERDLQDTFSYIANELKNKSAALDLLKRVEEVVNSLSQMPHRYQIVSNEVLSEQGLRLIPINNYLVFYVVREQKQKVVILRFLYARRDWITMLKKDSKKETEN